MGMRKGQVNSGSFKKGMKSWNTGLSVSGMSGKHQSEKMKRTLRNRNLVDNVSKRPEVKEKMRSAKIGRIGNNTGKHWKINKDKLKNLGKKNRGNKHWNWKGGISRIDRLCRQMSEYFQWRSNVFVRDNWTCRTCGITGVYVTAHHIKGFSKIIKENNIINQDEARECIELWDINNGITLCEECHKLTDNYKGRGIK